MLAQREGVELVGADVGAERRVRRRAGDLRPHRSYDEIGSLDPEPATYVDFAGDADVRQAVHSHYGDELAAAWRSGSPTGRTSAGGDGELPGPDAEVLLRPGPASRSARRTGARPGLEERVADAWHPFCEWTAGWLEVVRGNGFEAARGAPTSTCSRAGRAETARRSCTSGSERPARFAGRPGSTCGGRYFRVR